MPAKRDELERERDFGFEASLYLRGATLQKISDALADFYLKEEGREMKLSLRSILNDLEVIHQRWINSALVDFSAAKAKELAKLDEVERACWEGFNKAMAKKVTETVNESDGDGEKPAKRYRSTVKEDDVISGKYWIDTILACIDKRCKILGLFSPEKYQVDWRADAAKTGVDAVAADKIFQTMIQEAYVKLQDGHQLPVRELVERSESDDQI
jgi:hypothetical protein